MHRYFTIVFWLLSWGSASCVGQLSAQQLAFELPNHAGGEVVVQPGTARLTAVCFLGTQCPMAKAYSSTLSRLQQEYTDKGVLIVGVMSNRQDSLEDVQRYIAETQAEFPIVRDDHNQIADRYGATRTPEVFLLDEQLKLRYHGRIDDQYAPGVAKASASREDLRIAIDQLLAGKPVSVRETRALGCIIGRWNDDAPSAPHVETAEVTFTQDVHPMLQRHCIECHRAGEIGPFTMDSYQEVVGWAETMLETMEDGRMPPWHADPAYGHFANERLLPEEDKELFRAWIEQGVVEGPPVKLSVNARLSDIGDGWLLSREPDLALPMRDRPFTVPKDGVVEYQYFVVDPQFEEDKWVQAAQVMPGSRDVVHHAIVFVRPPDGKRFRGVGWLGGYVPGQRALELQPGQARLIPAGSKLVFQMHYTPVGTERDDITQVGLLFADPAEVTESVYTLVAIDQEFEIPPHAAAHEVVASLSSMPRQGQLLAVTPHMHFRGKSFKLTADYAGDDPSETLLSVPGYDFNWQHTYHFAQPLRLEQLEALRFCATFDNSDANPFNPDPSEWVTWGDQTWEEMAVAFFEVAVPREMPGELSANSRKSSEKAAADSHRSDRQAKIEQYIATALDSMDRNGDGIIRKSEVEIIVRRRFWQWDQDENSVVTRDELRQAAAALFP